jgi:hypothetical protein
MGGAEGRSRISRDLYKVISHCLNIWHPVHPIGTLKIHNTLALLLVIFFLDLVRALYAESSIPFLVPLCSFMMTL